MPAAAFGEYAPLFSCPAEGLKWPNEAASTGWRGCAVDVERRPLDKHPNYGRFMFLKAKVVADTDKDAALVMLDQALKVYEHNLANDALWVQEAVEARRRLVAGRQTP